MTINCNSISKYLFQLGQNQWIETTNLYYDIHTEGNVVVTVRVKARNNMQTTSIAESASQTTASFSKTIVLFFDCTLPSGLCLKQLIIWFNATNTWSFLEGTFKIHQISFYEGELLAWVICQDLSSLLLWEDNLLVCNSRPIPVVWVVNIASCDQLCGKSKKLLCNPFLNWTSRVKFTVGDRRQPLATVGDCRRPLAPVGDRRRPSATVGDRRQMSPTVGVLLYRQKTTLNRFW